MSENMWQPIETAPKDGSSVLCYAPLSTLTDERNHRILVMRWDEKGRQGLNWLTDIYPFVPFDPTHWMPLPGLPALSEESA